MARYLDPELHELVSTQAAEIERLRDARNELVVALHTLASNFENALYAFRDDDEARKKAEGDIAWAMGLAGRHNHNGNREGAQMDQAAWLEKCEIERPKQTRGLQPLRNAFEDQGWGQCPDAGAFDSPAKYAAYLEGLCQELADLVERLRASERSAWNAAVERDEEIERLRRD